MAALNGFLVAPVVYSGIINPNLSSDILDFENAWWPPHTSAAGESPVGLLSRAWPVNANGQTIPGFKAGSYIDDFYHRIHIIPTRLDLGNIISTQTSPVNLWNAFLTPQLLLNITGIDDGIELSGQSAPPLAFTALQEREWDVAITPDGPAVLDAQLQWNFASGSVAKLTITGNRITAFPWLIDWAKGVREKLTWATDILQSSTGAEQRRALRLAPRRNLSAPVILNKRERQFFDVATFGWAARVWAVPIWFDIQLLAGGVSTGAVVIACDTVQRDFRTNGLIMLLSESAFQYETAEILSITSTQLTLKRPLINNWPAGTRLYPARTARLEQAPKLTRLTDELQATDVDFLIVEPCEWPAVMPATLYRGYPVFDATPDESQDLTSQYQHLLLQLDNGSASALVTDTANLAFPVVQHRWQLFGRAERAAFRSLMYGFNGRQKAAWIPTHADDLTLAAIVTNTSTTMDIVAIGYTRFAQVKTGRNDIRVQMRNGTVYYRRITAAGEVTVDIERVQINASFGVEINPADVVRISWMMLMRADSDSVEIQHETDGDGLATSQQIFKLVRDDEL